jgi:hypothetical protein
VRLVLLVGLVFGLLASLFELAVQAISAFIAREVEIGVFTQYVSAALGFLIAGEAARRVAGETKERSNGWEVGAIIGAISGLVGSLGGAVIVSFSPVADAIIKSLSPQELQAANDPTAIAAALTVRVGVSLIFGALVGWLAAWSLLRFPPPRANGKGRVE